MIATAKQNLRLSASPKAAGEIGEYHLWHPFTQMQRFLKSQLLIVERGEGSYLFDQHGRKYLNLTSCLWNAPLGLGCTEIVEAVSRHFYEFG